MSDEKTLGEVYWGGYIAARRAADPDAPDFPHARLDDETRSAVEAGAQAVAAHVANPDAADYDAAAEVMRLRDLVAEILADFWPGERFEGISEGLNDAQARVDGYRERAGLERQR
jgi:hypothetical protein